jgi:hypothetical protein
MSDFDGAAEMITPTMAVVKSFDEDGRPLIVVRVPTAHELVELRRSDDANGHKALSTRTAIAIEPSPNSAGGADPH